MVSKKITYAGILTALAICASWVERFIPGPAMPVPGVKLGAANIITLVTLYLLGPGYALPVTVLRVAISGFLFGGVSGIIYGEAGGLAALAVMAALKRTGKPGVLGVSAAGGVIHNFAQLLLASWVMNTSGLFYYAPFLIVSGAAAGLFTGLCAHFVLPGIKKLSTTKA